MKREKSSIKKEFTWEKPFLSEAPYLVLVFADMKAPFTVYSTWIALGWHWRRKAWELLHTHLQMETS